MKVEEHAIIRLRERMSYIGSDEKCRKSLRRMLSFSSEVFPTISQKTRAGADARFFRHIHGHCYLVVKSNRIATILTPKMAKRYKFTTN